MEIKILLDIEAEEWLMNLVAQGYYCEAYELIEKLLLYFRNVLYKISASVIIG